jgi:aminobenzoyl-glutamate transport protein
LGNLLPHPVTLFALFALGALVLSAVASSAGLSVEDPRPGREGEMLEVTNLLSGEGIRWVGQSMVTNFSGFTPLGTVLVALLGVGVAEKSGLLTAIVRALVLNAPRPLVTLVVVVSGVVSNTASEMGYVVLIPLAMAIYHSLGRHPFAGLAAAFSGVSAGYSANILIGTVDPLLAGITEEAAQLIDPAYEVNPACNWYFMIGSTFLITALGWAITEYIVEPRLGVFDESQMSEDVDEQAALERPSELEWRGLLWAGVTALLISLGIVVVAGPSFLAGVVGWLPGWGVMRNPDPDAVGANALRPLLRSVVPLIVIFFVFPGFVYGRRSWAR